MDSAEYIDAVTGQMRCKRARAMVAKELSDHISDQTEDYVKNGMEPECAALEAVRQMGDAVEVGMEMDRLHRPQVDKRVLTIVAVFSLVAIFLQTMIVQALRASGDLSASAKTVPFQVLLGVLIMVGILYLDYTILGKHPLILWIAVLCVPFVCNAFALPGSSGHRTQMYLFLGVLIPAYVGVIYHYRKKGWLGFFCSLLWLLAGAFVYWNELYRSFLVLFVCVACASLLSYALGKGWYGISKVGSLVALWGGMIGGLLLFFVGSRYRRYLFARLEGFLNYAADPAGSGYMTGFMREGLENLTLLRPVDEWFNRWSNLDGYPIEESLSFYMVLQELGFVPVIWILLGFVVLFVCMARGVSKQKNMLGSLLGMACLLALLIPTLGHVLSNLTLIPYTDIYIPFLYPGWVANAASYTLLGLYLSVYRYTDVVA